MPSRVSIEICVDSAASAIAAERGGADRIELCANLREGGTTPSAGMIEVVRSQVALDIHVMVRPRAGDFCYRPEELQIMRRDIALAKRLGANGVVLGLLESGGNINVPWTKELVELARPLRVTFHRAFDLCRDLPEALEDVVLTGADRVLTSGGMQSAMEAMPAIENLVELARGRICILACGGIRPANAATIVRQTGVTEIHSGLSRPLKDAEVRGAQVMNGLSFSASTSGTTIFDVRESDVRDLRRAVELA
jgi:copper homeostasis protein